MIKGFFIGAFVVVLVGATGWLWYSRVFITNATTASIIDITNGTSTPTPSVGEVALQDFKKIMNPSSDAQSPASAQTHTLEGGLKVTDTKIGTGAQAVEGLAVAVHYTGRLADGTVFDSSVSRGKPFEFVLGKGMVIRGWDIGVQGMKVGGKRTLVIPPALAYGEAGAGGVIPPNATLTFDVELLAVQSVENPQ